MADNQVDAYAAALFEIARAEGVLDRAGDEVFRFSRTVESSPDLRSALTDPGTGDERKVEVLHELLGAKAHPVTVRLLDLVVEGGHVRELSDIANAFVARASAAGQASVAEVRVAAPISEEQRNRLAAALSDAKGRPVDVKVIVDPTV